MEEWRPVPDFEDAYEVSNMGRVRSIPRVVTRSNGRQYTVRERIMRGSTDNGRTVCLHIDGVSTALRIHRMMWNVFVGEIPDGFFLIHKDGDKNNAALNNLVLGTQFDIERMKKERSAA